MIPAIALRALSTLGFLGGLAAFVACSSTKKVELRQAAATPEDPNCVNHCYADPPPEPVDCKTAEKDVEFYPAPIWDFETVNDDGEFSGSNLYTYDDKTTFTLNPTGWQAPAIEMRRCRSDNASYGAGTGDASQGSADGTGGDGSALNHLFHISGGPFLEWGGGMGRHLKCINGTTDDTRFADWQLGVRKGNAGEGDPGEVLEFDPPIRATRTDKACGNAPSYVPCDRDSSELVQSICPERDLERLNGEKVDPEEEFMLGATLDLTEWDGISFWARRSPNSQSGIRLAVGDKYTDDDLRFLQAHISPDDKPYCEIKRKCGCEVANTECVRIPFYSKNAVKRGASVYDENGERIELGPDPEESLGTLPSLYDENGEIPLSRGETLCATEGDRERGYVLEAYTVRCGQSACNDIFESMQREDANSYGKPCTEYALKGSIVEAACFDPDTDPLPPENNDLCGDLWMSPVRLSTKWQFFKIPFTELLQQGWAKESPFLDLTSLALVRFTWDRGYIDYWLDDVRFYRNKR